MLLSLFLIKLEAIVSTNLSGFSISSKDTKISGKFLVLGENYEELIKSQKYIKTKIKAPEDKVEKAI